MRAALANLMRAAADVLWPVTCAVEGCGEPGDRRGRHVCSGCFSRLQFLDPLGGCEICGAPVTARMTHAFRCENCMEYPPSYDMVRSGVRYDETVSGLVQDFKYRRATWLAEDFADLLEGAVRGMPGFEQTDAVMPVPLHPNRKRARGYNQSELLARSLAKRLGRRCDAESLIRVVDTPKQSKLGGKERRENLKGAMRVARPEWVRGRVVVLVDDVMTTGSTVEECAGALKAAGAYEVRVATVARRMREGLAGE